MLYRCSSCGFEGHCYGTPLESRALTPFCPQCSKRNTFCRVSIPDSGGQCLAKRKKQRTFLTKICNTLENTIFVGAFLLAIFVLPYEIAMKNFSDIIINILAILFFWDHFFWHKYRLSNCIEDYFHFRTRSINGKN